MPKIFYTIGQRDHIDTFDETYKDEKEVRKTLEEVATDPVAEGEVFFIYEIKKVARSKVVNGKETWCPM